MMIAYLLSLIVGQMLNAGAETDLIYRILLYRQLSDIFPDRPEKASVYETSAATAMEVTPKAT